MIEAVVVDQDQVWEPVIIEIGLDVLNVGDMIISLKTLWMQKQKRARKIQQMFYLDEGQ